jgi:hypothetical protein
MYTHIYQNSFVAMIFAFLLICMIFYIFHIGYSMDIENGTIVSTFNWKYPLAIAFLVWLLWYFVFFPPSKNTKNKIANDPNLYYPKEITQLMGYKGELAQYGTANSLYSDNVTFHMLR